MTIVFIHMNAFCVPIPLQKVVSPNKELLFNLNPPDTVSCIRNLIACIIIWHVVRRVL